VIGKVVTYAVSPPSHFTIQSYQQAS